jgi:hypothetical protein
MRVWKSDREQIFCTQAELAKTYREILTVPSLIDRMRGARLIVICRFNKCPMKAEIVSYTKKG